MVRKRDGSERRANGSEAGTGTRDERICEVGQRIEEIKPIGLFIDVKQVRILPDPL